MPSNTNRLCELKEFAILCSIDKQAIFLRLSRLIKVPGRMNQMLLRGQSISLRRESDTEQKTEKQYLSKAK